MMVALASLAARTSWCNIFHLGQKKIAYQEVCMVIYQSGAFYVQLVSLYTYDAHTV